MQNKFYKRQRTASGQLEPGAGGGVEDEMPFSSHEEPLLCGQRSIISLWAAQARVAPGSCLQLRSSCGLLRLQASSPGVPTPRPLLSCFVPTQSWATRVSHLFGRNSRILTPVTPLALRALMPSRNISGNQEAVIGECFMQGSSLSPNSCLSACKDTEAGHLTGIMGSS